MKRSLWNIAITTMLCSLAAGCISSDPDFCSLLSLEEVMELDHDVVSGEMSLRGRTAPTWYCVYNSSNNDEVLLLSIGNPTDNTPYSILRTYLAHMEGDNSVELIEGIGYTAAALFSEDYEFDKFRILIANGDEWSVTVRAKGITNMRSRKFSVLKELANKALERF